jgi:hypothetical protein
MEEEQRLAEFARKLRESFESINSTVQGLESTKIDPVDPIEKQVKCLVQKCHEKGVRVSCNRSRLHGFWNFRFNGRKIGFYTDTGALNLLHEIFKPTYPDWWFIKRKINPSEIRKS